MNKKSEFSFSDPKQERSKKTLDDIMQAALEIIESADPEKFNSRSLAKKSGYSLGTLSRRLRSIENIFFWAIQKGRENEFNQIVKILSEFDTKVTVQGFVETLVDEAFRRINRINPKVMQFYEQRFTKKYGLTIDYFSYIDPLIKAYLDVCSKNEAKSFKIMSENEARLNFRAIVMIGERPFLESDPMAGTDEHRRIAIETISRMLRK
jgi:hypothetical protein